MDPLSLSALPTVHSATHKLRGSRSISSSSRKGINVEGQRHSTSAVSDMSVQDITTPGTVDPEKKTLPTRRRTEKDSSSLRSRDPAANSIEPIVAGRSPTAIFAQDNAHGSAPLASQHRDHRVAERQTQAEEPLSLATRAKQFTGSTHWALHRRQSHGADDEQPAAPEQQRDGIRPTAVHDGGASTAPSAVKVPPESHFMRPAATAPSKRRPLFYVLLLAACLAALLATVIIVVVLMSESPVRPANVCSTHECWEYGKMLMSSIDASERPCHNFTRFVCGGWQQEHQLSVREELYQRAIERITRLVRTIEVPLSEQNSVQRAAAVYRSCDNVLYGDTDDLKAVKLSLLEAGVTWPKHNNARDVVHTLLYSSLILGWHVILRVVPKWHGQRLTLLVDPGGAFHLVVRRPRAANADSHVYFKRLRDIFGTGNSDDTKFEDVVDAEKNFREELTAAYNDRTDYQDFPERTFLGLGDSRWVEVMRKMNLTATENFKVLTTGRRFVYAFFNLWDNHGEAGAYSFTAWCTVQVAALYANRELVLNYHSGSAKRAMAYYGAFCVTAAYTFSHYALFGSYNAEVLRGRTRPVAEAVTRAVGDAFLKRLFRWRHFKNNIEVVANWSSLSRAFEGFDAVYDPTLDPVGFDMTNSFVANWRRSTLVPSSLDDVALAEAVNSLELFALYFVGERRDFQLLGAALSFPFFDVGLTAAVNYGGLGARVAWALGLLFLAAYSADERSNASVSQLKSCVAGSSHSEDADSIAAVAVTAAALLDALEADVEASRLPVPRAEGFTSTQLFFVALCFTLCEGSDSGRMAGVCDRSLKHVRRFAEAFECAKGSPMHPAERCNLL